MFFVAAGIYAAGATFYNIFASGDLQPWAAGKVAEPKEEEMTMMDKKPVNGAVDDPKV